MMFSSHLLDFQLFYLCVGCCKWINAHCIPEVYPSNLTVVWDSAMIHLINGMRIRTLSFGGIYSARTPTQLGDIIIYQFNMIKYHCITGWWFQPLWKILVNGKDYPIYHILWKTNVWNHQSDNVICPPSDVCWFQTPSNQFVIPTTNYRIHLVRKPLPCRNPKLYGTSHGERESNKKGNI